MEAAKFHSRPRSQKAKPPVISTEEVMEVVDTGKGESMIDMCQSKPSTTVTKTQEEK